MKQVRQAVILCGGLGTRLGALTASTPKPLLPVGGKPFLSVLVEEVLRQGVCKVLLLASFEAEQVRNYAMDLRRSLRRNVSIDVVVEPERAGTGGALWHARGMLDESFFMLNGDSWFDLPLYKLRETMNQKTDLVGVMALHERSSPGRYGSVELQGHHVIAFDPGAKRGQPGPALINAGVYLFRRTIINYLGPKSSLEVDALPRLAEERVLAGVHHRGYFIDIGIPEDLARAQSEVADVRCRPALFLDRDGVINVDHGYVGTIARHEWIPGAREAIRAANRAGYYVFVVTNQAGIGHGYYSEEDFWQLSMHINGELAEIGAHVDDQRFCPFHPAAKVPIYRKASNWRKPAPGMLLDLIKCWPIDIKKSLMIGDKTSDLEAAAAVGVAGYLFSSGSLEAFVRPLLAKRRRSKISGDDPEQA